MSCVEKPRLQFDLQGCDALVIAAASERSADLFWATGFRAPDPFVYVHLPQESLIMVSDLELGRARNQAAVERVVARSQYEELARQRGDARPGADAVLLALLRDLAVHDALVPADFPVRSADFLRDGGVRLRTVPLPVFAQRQTKTTQELEAIRASMVAAERSLDTAIDLIRRADVCDGVLVLEGAPLTSERVRQAIHHTLLDFDCQGAHTIVAGGVQGCDPHQEGHGPLRAGESIVIDIFPQSMSTGYFGDITRTVARGPVSPALRELYAAVEEAQSLGLERISAGMDGAQLHRQIQQLFAARGYRTGEVDGHMQGFFHGTGHGVGLEVHEAPRIGVRGDVLRPGHVVTVEPGLYYPALGGVRLEDTVVVREHGCDNLTTFPKFFEV